MYIVDNVLVSVLQLDAAGDLAVLEVRQEELVEGDLDTVRRVVVGLFFIFVDAGLKTECILFFLLLLV